MKQLIIAIITLFSISAFAQKSDIKLVDFEKKVRLNTVDLKGSDLIKASSSCAGEVKVTHTDDLFSGGCAGTVQRTYKLSDECGNKLEAVQFITLEDNTAPTFINPPQDITLTNKTDLQQPATPAVQDESGQHVTVSFKADFDHSDPDLYKVIRTWTASDLCENTRTHTQVISIEVR